MHDRTAWARKPITTEYRDADLGDARLDVRLQRIAAAAELRPWLSFPQMLASDAELEAFYRFVANERVTAKAVLGPHIAATVARATSEHQCLVVHDTTEFNFGGLAVRQGLGRTGASTSGFLAHVSLAVSCDAVRVPLGVVALESFARTGVQKPKRTSSARRKDTTRESLRWARQLLHVETLREGGFEAIHVMDREADIYELMAAATQAGARFVLRAAQDRVVEEGAEDAAVTKLFEVARSAPTRTTRTIELSERAAGINPTVRKRHPARRARSATVALSTCTVVLHRSARGAKTWPATLKLNVVRVGELDAPSGEPPVEWILVTTEPIATVEQLERVVDWYRARWTVEEYFKALKTGCALEKRQNESYDALVTVLAVFIPIAWRMLLMRALARVAPTAPATCVLSARHGKLAAERTGRTVETVADALAAVARLGGHLKRNGPPGWQTIARGYRELLLLELGWEIGVRAGLALGPPRGFLGPEM